MRPLLPPRSRRLRGHAEDGVLGLVWMWLESSVFFVLRGERFTDDHQASIRVLVTTSSSVRPELPLSEHAG